MVIFPSDPKNAASIRNWITQENFRYTEARAPSVSGGGFTAFFYVESLTYDERDLLYFLPGIDGLYTVEEHIWDRNSITDDLTTRPLGNTDPPPVVRYPKRWDANLVVGQLNQSRSGLLSKRATESQSSAYWELSQMSSPRGHDWMDPNIQSGGSYKYYYHESAGEGQYIYAVEESFYLIHDEFAGKAAAKQAVVLPETPYGSEQQGASLGLRGQVHGMRVASKAVGKVLGVAKKATIVVPQMPLSGPTGPAGSGPDWAREHKFLGERILDSYIRIMEHVMASDDKGPNKIGRSVINYSNGEFEDLGPSHPAAYRMLHKILMELESMKVLVVASAHNEYRHDTSVMGPGYLPNGRGDEMRDIPQRWANPADAEYLSNLIVVSTTDINTQVGNINPYANWASFAPGAGIAVAEGNGIQRGHDGSSYGESFSASPIPPNSC